MRGKLISRNMKHRRMLHLDTVGRLCVTWVDAGLSSVMVGNRIMEYAE